MGKTNYVQRIALQRKVRRQEGMRRLTLNTDQEKGKAVTVADVKMHALDGHVRCRGTGIVIGTRNVSCMCALKRFFKKHPEVILDATGAAFWPAKKEEEKADGTDTGTVGADSAGAGEPGPGSDRG